MLEPIPSTKPQICVATILAQVSDMSERASDLGRALKELRENDSDAGFLPSDISSHLGKRTDDARWLCAAMKDTRASVRLLVQEYITTRNHLFGFYGQPVKLLGMEDSDAS